MAGLGGQITIGGQNYTQGTPEAIAAMNAFKTQQAGAAGTAQGTGAGHAATEYIKELQSTGLPLLNSSSGTGGSASASSGNTGTPSPVPPPSLTGLSSAASAATSAPAAHLAPVDTSDAERAAFAQAKDQVGQESSSALTGLRSALAGRGQLGGGGEFRGTANIINKGQQELGDVSRQAAITKAGQAQANATTSYEGEINQRGQDLTTGVATRGQDASLAQSGYEGAITQRGQDINAQIENDRIALARSTASVAQQQQALQGLLGALGSFSKGSY